MAQATIIVILVPPGIVVDESNETGAVAGPHRALSHQITVYWNARAGKKLAIS
jgi:hypothetical protein